MKNCWPQWTFCMRTWSRFASCWCCEWGCCCSCAPLALSGTQPGRSNGNSASTSCLRACQSVRQSVWLSLRGSVRLLAWLPAECWYYMGSCLPQCLPYFYSYRFKFYGSSCCKFRSSRVANFVFVAVLRHSFLESILLECLSRVP